MITIDRPETEVFDRLVLIAEDQVGDEQVIEHGTAH
jgi:hypothetical protein